MIRKEQLEARLIQLGNQLQQARTQVANAQRNIDASQGAIQDTRYWLDIIAEAKQAENGTTEVTEDAGVIVG